MPDISTPPSDALNKALNIELYDRAVANPLTNQEEALRTLLFGSYQKTKPHVDKFINKPEETQAPLPGKGSPDVLSKLFGQQKGLAMEAQNAR